MDQEIRLIIHRNEMVYDNLLISEKAVLNFDNTEYMNDQSSSCTIFTGKILRKKGFNAYLASAYVYSLKFSDTYRKSASKFLILWIHAQKLELLKPVLIMKLRHPRTQFIDYIWNDIISTSVREYEEINNAFSWLSTLGGAFSALGDEFDHCAKKAGKISFQQFKLALRLGDPQLVGRCKLYLALSLLQLGYYKTSRGMIQDIFKFSVNTKDWRLENMCRGVWAKLQYSYSQKKSKEKERKETHLQKGLKT